MCASRSEITQVLRQLGEDPANNRSSADRLFELVYDELRCMATDVMRSERRDHTLQPTALVHEVYCRLVDLRRIQWQNRAHFFGIVARAMRRILVEHARRRATARRGGGWERVALDDALDLVTASEVEVLDLDEALTRLGEMDERAARVVELRIFAGMNAREIAHVLGISRRTVDGDWHVGRMWLARQLERGDAS